MIQGHTTTFHSNFPQENGEPSHFTTQHLLKMNVLFIPTGCFKPFLTNCELLLKNHACPDDTGFYKSCSRSYGPQSNFLTFAPLYDHSIQNHFFGIDSKKSFMLRPSTRSIRNINAYSPQL